MHTSREAAAQLLNVGCAVADLEKAAAKERQREAGRTKAPANLAEAAKGDSRDKVAAYTGVGHTTLDKATAIVEAAERRTGEMLAESEKAKGTRSQLAGRDSSGASRSKAPENSAPTLKRLGISKTQSARRAVMR